VKIRENPRFREANPRHPRTIYPSIPIFQFIFLFLIKLPSRTRNTIYIIKIKPMKKIACIALLAVFFTNCKQSNPDEKVELAKKPVDTVAVVKEEKTKKADEDCKDIEVEMGSGKECIVKTTDLNAIYQGIIANKEVEETEFYLTTIPTENKSVTINKNGLISIDYEITKDKVAIAMNYEGGLTEVTLEKIKDTIKKSIYHYAD